MRTQIYVTLICVTLICVNAFECTLKLLSKLMVIAVMSPYIVCIIIDFGAFFHPVLRYIHPVLL